MLICNCQNTLISRRVPGEVSEMSLVQKEEGAEGRGYPNILGVGNREKDMQ